jgi:AcrR family transcriptional regulator
MMLDRTAHGSGEDWRERGRGMNRQERSGVQYLDLMKRQLPSSYNPARAAKLLNRKESPRDRLREKRIEEIVEVAVELFAKEGAAGFSMRRVASLAGVTLSTLQHYFGKGENLLQITINSITARYIDRLRAIEHDEKVPARERFRVITDEIIGWSTDPVVSDCYFELYALASKDKEVARLIEEVYVAYQRLLTDFVSKLNPTITRARAAMIALMIGAQIDGVMILRYRGASAMPDTDANVIAAMKDAWLREIFSPASTDDRDDRTRVTVVVGPRDSEQAKLGGQRVRIAHQQSVPPLLAQTRSKRRETT